MPRFAKMLSDGMQNRKHSVEVWSPEPHFFKMSENKSLKKWLGYIDQYIIFPAWVKKRLKECDKDSLFVFTDHALGPWVPLVSDRAHVVHCHDFLAQQSALGKIKENPTGFTGKLYQKYIRKGYTQGENFISVSNKTNLDLQQFLNSDFKTFNVVYNGLNQDFKFFEPAEARETLGKIIGLNLSDGYILHIGGNQWYKNRTGVIEIYDAWRNLNDNKLPLLLIGKKPTLALSKKKEESAFAEDIFFLEDITNEQIILAYAGARLLLFPSLAEGFGWPIAEAMASGCPVVTTNEAPMTEVAGDAGFFIPKRPDNPEAITKWANEAAEVIKFVVNLSPSELETVVQNGIKNSKRFDTECMLNSMEEIYTDLLKSK